MMNILKQRLNVVSMADFVEMFLAVPRARLYYADGSFAGFIMTSYFDQQIISMEEFVEGKYRSYSEPNAWHAKIVVSSNLLRVCAVAHSWNDLSRLEFKKSPCKKGWRSDSNRC